MKHPNDREASRERQARRDPPEAKPIPPRDAEREHGLYEEAAQDEEQERHSPTANDVY